MIVQKNFLNKLKDFGLNTYESKLWAALLSRGLSTAGELSDIANVPRSRTYDVLEALERKGFIIRRLGKPIKYVAVPPEEVLERVKTKIKADMDKKLEMMEEIKGSKVLEELNILHSQGIELIEPTDLTGSVTGRENIYNHIESRLSKAEGTVSILTTSEGFLRKADVLAPVFRNLKKKGAKVRIATQLRPDMKETVAAVSKYAEVRHTDIHGRFLIINSEEVIFMLLDDRLVHPSYDVAVWASTKFFANAFEKVFDAKWNDMSPAESFFQ